MGNEVYANGREISCKQAAGKSIAAFPDVCLSPPSPPAGPVPIPYPNTAYSSDTTDGSKTVQISGAEVMLKNQSCFKKSTGDEAATRSLGMGVITHTITGKVYFNSWSMDVKIEDANVIRHLDVGGHNCNPPQNTVPWPYSDNVAFATSKECAADRRKIEKKCTGDKKKDCPKKKSDYKTSACMKARRCMLVPYKPKSGCCPAQTGHHLVPKHLFGGNTKYNEDKAPCVCAEGWSWHRNDESGFTKKNKTHPDLHDIQDFLERESLANDETMTYGEVRDNGVAAHATVFPEAACNADCIAQQLDAYHKDQVGIGENDPVEAKATGAAKPSSSALERITKAKAILKKMAQDAAEAASAATGAP